jgi:tRNA-specific 2-thiouridylase
MIVVALSGGVDSATAAALLVERGERVVGVTMRLYDARGTSAASGRCCGPRDVEDARRVAAHLGIPFYVADYEEEFRARVIDDFVAEYAAGATPNPCVRCNQHIKFTPLLRRARALGADALATGHYARLDGGRLLRARDAQKDQSYFLFAMPEAARASVRFPLGELTKDEVRAHAKRLGLPNADKPESQEICFVPDGDYAAFVAARASSSPGEIVDEAGRVVGRHDGVHRFTVGQRRGIRVAALEPRYVLAVDAPSGRVTIGPAESLDRREVLVEELIWPGGLSSPRRVQAQIRYRHAPRPATVTPLDGDRALVTFDAPERAPAPGQAAVFYDGDEVLGGGFIRPQSAADADARDESSASPKYDAARDGAGALPRSIPSAR